MWTVGGCERLDARRVGWHDRLMESLILQRMRIDRTRTWGRVLLIGGALWLVLSGLLIAADPSDISGFAFLGLTIGWIVVGFRQLAKHRAAVAAFETEHGADAGTQQPVRMPSRARGRSES